MVAKREEGKDKKRGRKVRWALMLWLWRWSNLSGGLGPVHKGYGETRKPWSWMNTAWMVGMRVPPKSKWLPAFSQCFLFFQHPPTVCLPVAGNPPSQNLFLLYPSLSTEQVPQHFSAISFSHCYKAEWETGRKDGSGQPKLFPRMTFMHLETTPPSMNVLDDKPQCTHKSKLL